MNDSQTTPGRYIVAVRAALGCRMIDIAEPLGFTRITLHRWQREGGPPWLRFALLGLLLDRGGGDAVLEALTPPATNIAKSGGKD